jgi:hypothetical protein
LEDARAVGKLFVNVTLSGPGPVADLIVEAALSEDPRRVYPCALIRELRKEKNHVF